MADEPVPSIVLEAGNISKGMNYVLSRLDPGQGPPSGGRRPGMISPVK